MFVRVAIMLRIGPHSSCVCCILGLKRILELVARYLLSERSAAGSGWVMGQKLRHGSVSVLQYDWFFIVWFGIAVVIVVIVQPVSNVHHSLYANSSAV